MSIKRCALLAVLGALTFASSASASWLDQSTPPPPNGRIWNLSGVSCPSGSACEAVGGYLDTGSATHILAESRSGKTWTLQPVADPSGLGSPALNAVACRSATACVAVGTAGASGGAVVPISEVWDGASWTARPVPAPAGATTTTLSAIACPSASLCVAVGSTTGPGGVHLFVETFNGSSWSIASAPEPAGATATTFDAVTCRSTSFCLAVGSATSASGTVTLAEKFNTTSWSIQSTPNPSGLIRPELEGVSCSATTACTATGFSFAERYNGSSWTLQTIARPGGTTAADLTGVSCTTATSCVAAGSHYDGEAVQQLVVEAWNGTAWRVLPAPISTSSDSSFLATVSCAATNDCTAVGSYHDPVTGNRALVEFQTLRWGQLNTSQPTGTIGGNLEGISCKPAFNCATVGNFETSSDFETVAENFAQNQWTIEPTPNPAQSNFDAVSCTSQTACTVVGDMVSGSDLVTLAQRWNGTTYAVQATPNPSGAVHSFLTGVSCPTLTACIATGFSTDSGGTQRLLAERWDGTNWTITTPPAPAGSLVQFNGVSCASASACLAVGSFSGGIFAERWNGSSWTLLSPPTPSGGSSPHLSAVSCSAATACTVVGGYFAGSTQLPLAERWDGTNFTVQTVPVPGGRKFSSFLGISCPSATVCVTVGTSRSSTGPQQNLAEHWTSGVWAVQSIPTPSGSQGGWLLGVSCGSTTVCFGAGFFTDSSGLDELLTYEYQ